MSERKDDGTQPSPYGLPQMSLRDYFAAQALAGLAARINSETVRKYAEDVALGREALIAYRLADAMLKERAK